MKRKRNGKQNWGAMALVMVLALFLFAPNSAIGAVVVIDDMTVQQGSSASPDLTECTDGQTQQSGVTGPVANMIGGARIIEITHTASIGTACTKTYVDGGTPSGYAVVNDSNSTGWGRAVWNGSSTVMGNFGLNLDLTYLDHFNFTYVKADDPTTFTFRVYNDATHGSEATIVIVPAGGAVLEDEQRGKADFGAIAGVANQVNWANPIKRMALIVEENLDVDTFVREIQAITQEPDLSCTKDFDKGYVESGDEITATVVITNTGDVQTSVKVVDELDAGLTYKEVVAPTPVPDDVTGQTLTWNSLGPLAPSASLTLTYVITVDTIAEGDVLCNDVTAEALDFQGTDTNCQACVRTAPKAPTFTQWGMIVFFLVLGAVAVCFMRRRSSVS